MLPALLNPQNSRQNDITSKPPPIFLPLVAQRVSFATLRRPHKIKGLHVAYVSSKKGLRTGSAWSQIGAAWFNKDGEGINYSLTLCPFRGVSRYGNPRKKPKTLTLQGVTRNHCA
jgi:hypothetical protein